MEGSGQRARSRYRSRRGAACVMSRCTAPGKRQAGGKSVGVKIALRACGPRSVLHDETTLARIPMAIASY